VTQQTVFVKLWWVCSSVIKWCKADQFTIYLQFKVAAQMAHKVGIFHHSSFIIIIK